MEEIIDSSGQGLQNDETNHEHNEVSSCCDVVIEIHNSSFLKHIHIYLMNILLFFILILKTKS